jgi:hypothetical protein
MLMGWNAAAASPATVGSAATDVSEERVSPSFKNS